MYNPVTFFGFDLKFLFWGDINKKNPFSIHYNTREDKIRESERNTSF